MTRDTAKTIIECNLKRLDERGMRLVCFFILHYVDGKKKAKERGLNDKARSGGTH